MVSGRKLQICPAATVPEPVVRILHAVSSERCNECPDQCDNGSSPVSVSPVMLKELSKLFLAVPHSPAAQA